jgi:nucleoside-diphosphate-sugar epimerase
MRPPKLAGIKMCQACRRQYGCDFISAMPTNMCGPNDNDDPQGSHVLPAFIRRFHEAKISRASSMTCWGTGTPLWEFLHSEDLGRACAFLVEKPAGRRPCGPPARDTADCQSALLDRPGRSARIRPCPVAAKDPCQVGASFVKINAQPMEMNEPSPNYLRQNSRTLPVGVIHE